MPFRGIGAWTSVFQWSPSVTGRPLVRPEDVGLLPFLGVSTLYIQTARTSGGATLTDRSVLRRFVVEAHRAKISVVGWYLPTLTDLRRDLDRLTAPLDVGVDAIGVDIESTSLDPSTRSRRQVRLLEQLRSRFGRRTPVGAIVYSPLGLELNPGTWPGFPWQRVSQLSDVLLPMGYWTFRRGSTPALDDGYRYTNANFTRLRRLTGRNASTVHTVGGIASDLRRNQAADMARSIAEHRGLGGSLYEWSGTSRRSWDELSRLSTR